MTIYLQLVDSTMIKVGIFSHLICAFDCLQLYLVIVVLMLYFKNSRSQKLCKVRAHIIN